MKKNISTDKAPVIEKESYVQLPLVKVNFIMMAIAGAAIIIGFLLMLGGAPPPSSSIPTYSAPAA